MMRFLSALSVACLFSVSVFAQEPAAAADSAQTKSVQAVAWHIASNIPFHVEGGLELGSTLQQSVTINNYLVRAPLFLRPSFKLELGMEWSSWIIAVFGSVEPYANVVVKDLDRFQGLAPKLGLSWLVGGKAMVRLDNEGYIALGGFLGYYRNSINVKSLELSDLHGQGVLAGGEFRWRPEEPFAVTGKLGAGPEWVHTKVISSGQEIQSFGLVVMASLGVSLSWNREPKVKLADEALKFAGLIDSASADSDSEPADDDDLPVAKMAELEPSTVQQQVKQVEEEPAAPPSSSSPAKVETPASQPASPAPIQSNGLKDQLQAAVKDGTADLLIDQIVDAAVQQNPNLGLLSGVIKAAAKQAVQDGSVDRLIDQLIQGGIIAAQDQVPVQPAPAPAPVKETVPPKPAPASVSTPLSFKGQMLLAVNAE